MGEVFIPSVIHDYDYQVNDKESRKACDQAFYDNMIHPAIGMDEDKARAFYNAVRLGAKETWCRYRGIEMPKPKRKAHRRKR
jgi:hypothetical protein